MIQFPYVVETSRGPVTFRTVGAPIVGITQDDVDAAEWQALESEHIRCPRSGYLIPKPDRISRDGVMTWTGTGCGKGRANASAYKLPGKSMGAVTRAKSTAQAELMLGGTSARYTLPQLGPVQRHKAATFVLKYNTKKNIWTYGGR